MNFLNKIRDVCVSIIDFIFLFIKLIILLTLGICFVSIEGIKWVLWRIRY